MASISLGPPVQPASSIGSVLRKWRNAVYMRQTWSDDWVYIPYLTAVSGRHAVFPGKSTVQLRFDYGKMAREGRTFFFDYAQYGRHDYFICIKAKPEAMRSFVLWTGVVPAHAFDVFATKVDGTIVTTAGRETLTAHGFEYFLARRRVVGGWVYDAGASPYTAKNIGWAPSFNDRHSRGAALMGNRSAEKIVTDAPPLPLSYGFGSDLDANGNPHRWSVRDIIEYLLEWSNPVGGVSPSFVLAGPNFDPYDLIGYLDGLYDIVPQDGRNVWDLLKKLLDRRRGVGAYLMPSFVNGMPDGLAPITLYVYSMTDAPATVGNFTFPGNPNWIDLTIDEDVTLQRGVVRIDSLNAYDKIDVVGERVVSCFSAEIDPRAGFAPIEPAWPAADETAYRAADDEERKRMKDRWERVYRMFRLPEDFDWFSGYAFNPTFDNDGNIEPTRATVAPYWNKMHRLLNWLPIRSSAAMAAESVVPGMTKPLVFCETFDKVDGTPTGRWVWVESPTGVDGVVDENEAASVTMHDREGLIEVRHKTQHYLARNHLASDPDQDDTGSEPVFDYERMVITMAVEADSRPRVQVTTLLVGGLNGRTLTIPVPGAQVWIVGFTTAIALNADGSLAYYTGSGVERDDTDQLRAIAALAKSIYGKRRAAVRVTEIGLWAIAELGTMVRAVSMNQQLTPVNAVVTELSWDFERGTTTVQTGFLDLDTRRVR